MSDGLYKASEQSGWYAPDKRESAEGWVTFYAHDSLHTSGQIELHGKELMVNPVTCFKPEIWDSDMYTFSLFFLFFVSARFTNSKTTSKKTSRLSYYF